MFNNENAPGGYGFWNKTRMPKLWVLFLVDFLKNVELLQPPFLFILGVQPDLLVAVAWVKSCFEGRETWAENVFSQDKDWGWSIVACRWTK